jgi:ribose-phosphate pyrophosphokinase
MIVIPGPASPKLGEMIAEELGVESHPVDHRLFPDGESYIRITASVKGQDVLIVQTTMPRQDSSLIQLFLMAGTARDMGARRLICAVPYLAYSRQDKRFLDGEALSLDLIIELLEATGVDELIVVDALRDASLRRTQRNRAMRIVNLSAIPLLAKHLVSLGFEGAYGLSPDKGAINLAKAGAEVLQGDHGFFEKTRDRRTGEIEMSVKDVDVEGEKAVVFDDIISSGGTMAKAVTGLKAQGVVSVAAACTHGLFMDGAEEKIKTAGADFIMATDTVETHYSHVSVAKLIAEHVKREMK